MKFILLLIALMVTTSAFSQIVAGRQVLGSCGTQSVSGNTSISGTVGESIIGTKQAPSAALTQGFQQGKTTGVIVITVETENASCPTSTDGIARINSLIGCDPPYVITWSDGTIGEFADRLTPGSHSVSVVSGNCAGQISFFIGSGPAEDCRIRFFNAFSPNGDLYNDIWRIENIQLPEFSKNKVEIYNRWGQLVWDGENYNNASVFWDGRTSEGNQLPAGTYYFIANFSGVLHKGFIELTL